jgi:hypothetical protein
MMHHKEIQTCTLNAQCVCVSVCIYSGHDDVRAHRTID